MSFTYSSDSCKEKSQKDSIVHLMAITSMPILIGRGGGGGGCDGKCSTLLPYQMLIYSDDAHTGYLLITV